MRTYIIRRLLQSIPTLIGASILFFFLFQLIPGDYVSTYSETTPERAAELRHLFGLDKSHTQQYLSWAGDVLKGDIGTSFRFQRPVMSVINMFIWNSFFLAFSVMILQWLVATFLGILSAVKRATIYDGVTSLFTFIAMSLPVFFAGLFLLKIFAVDLRLFPLGGKITTGSNYTGIAFMIDSLKHMALPMVTLFLLNIGGLIRYFRSSMLDVITQDYIRTARAKGLKERVVIMKHSFRNALLPMITLFALEFPGLFAGSIIVEKIFLWPGIGKVVLDGIYMRDYPLFLGFTMLLAVITVISNLLADVLYGVADPRIRLK